MKKFLIIANWKLNGSIKMISDFFKHFIKLYKLNYLEKNNIVIAPPTIYLERVNNILKNNKINIFLGAQNVDINVKGAFTGETSISMLQDINVKYVIIGHSERRLWHRETHSMISKKLYLIKQLNLIPVLCVGETEIDRRHKQTKNVIKEQLNSVFEILGNSAFRNTIIAYEPIWAIGTGLSANPTEVQLIHRFIKDYIQKHDSKNIKNIIIQYGGSINATNVKEFIVQPDINGLLIGNASLNVQEFIEILNITSNHS